MTVHGQSCRPRVLQVHHFRYPEVRGGVDRVVTQLLRGLGGDDALLWEVGRWRDRLLSRRRDGGLDVFRKRLRGRARELGLARRVLESLERGWTERQLTSVIQEQAIDVVHLHTFQAYHEYFVRLAEKGICRYVVTLHGSETLAYPERPSRQQAAWKRILDGADAVVAVSRVLADEAKEHLPLSKDPVVVHNGIADPELEPDVPGRALPARPYALCVGALEPYKGHDVAVEAWARLGSAGDELPLLIAGDGPARADLERRIATAGSGDRVRLLGACDHRTTLRLLAGATLQIMPSRREGMGLALLEGAALERPVIAADLPVFREVLEDGVSVRLFPVNDADALTETVRELIGDPEGRRALGRAARARYMEKFTLDHMVRGYAEVYRTVTRDA